MNDKQDGEALKLFNRAIQLDPRHAKALFKIGVLRASKGEAAKAMELWRRAVKADPRYVAAHYNMGQALQLGGKHEDEIEISLGSYAATNAFARQSGTLKRGQRLYHLDGYFEGGKHHTYRMFKAAPSYAEARSLAIQAIEGKLKPTSSTTPR